MFMAVSLAGDGYFNQNPCTVLDSPVDIVWQTYHYNQFKKTFETTFHELNRSKK